MGEEDETVEERCFLAQWGAGARWSRRMAGATPDEQRKENERIDKQRRRRRRSGRKDEEKGKETDPQGHEEMTVSRLLELGSFTNPRRVMLNGRSTIAVDYTGDPKAKTRNQCEEVVRE